MARLVRSIHSVGVVAGVRGIRPRHKAVPDPAALVYERISRS
jgi:hypothetical protein